MSKLQEAAMARVPLSPEEVEKHWLSHGLVIEVLCESHERLRMERDAAKALLDGAEERIRIMEGAGKAFLPICSECEGHGITSSGDAECPVCYGSGVVGPSGGD